MYHVRTLSPLSICIYADSERLIIINHVFRHPEFLVCLILDISNLSVSL